MIKISIWCSVRDLSDGFIHWYLTEAEANANGVGVVEVETFEGSNVHEEAIENAKANGITVCPKCDNCGWLTNFHGDGTIRNRERCVCNPRRYGSHIDYQATRSDPDLIARMFTKKQFNAAKENREDGLASIDHEFFTRVINEINKACGGDPWWATSEEYSSGSMALIEKDAIELGLVKEE